MFTTKPLMHLNKDQMKYHGNIRPHRMHLHVVNKT